MLDCSLPFNCLYTTSSSELSLFSSTSWLMLGPCAVPLPRGLFPSAGASGPAAWTLRVLHLAQKVMNPATAITFSTSKTLHLLNTKAIKKSPVSGLRVVGGQEGGESPEKPYVSQIQGSLGLRCAESCGDNSATGLNQQTLQRNSKDQQKRYCDFEPLHWFLVINLLSYHLAPGLF